MQNNADLTGKREREERPNITCNELEREKGEGNGQTDVVWTPKMCSVKPNS